MLIMNMMLNRRRTKVLFAAAFILLAALVGCDGLKVTTVYDKGAASSSDPLATKIGLKVLKDGGNAVDAAVAIGFALSVTHPEAGNIGGGGFAMVRDGKTGEIEALDFRENAPAAASETMYLDENGEVIESSSTLGALSSGVPGTVAGLYDMWQRYGSLKWEDLVTSAAELADTGFVVDQYLHDKLNEYAERLRTFPETSEHFFEDSKIPQVGENFKQPDLAHSLYLIAAEGKDPFYTGEIASLVLATMDKYGGVIDSSDLASYETRWLTPVHFEFDSLEFYSMPPPSSGGPLIGQILKLLEPYDLSTMSTSSSEYIHLFAETCRLAYADRSQHLGDPKFYDVPDFLLNDDYLLQRRSLINREHATPSTEVTPGGIAPPVESTETTSFSVADDDGNIVSITYTINSSFGSKLVVEGAGFLLNNEMDDFAIKPGVPNLYGLVGSEANKIEPRKQMLSSMAPTIVLKNGEPYFTLGSKGGSQIISAIASVILNVRRFGMDLKQAVAAPRYHHQWLPDELALEKSSFDIQAVQDLIGRGHAVVEENMISEVNGIMFEEGLFIPVADPRTRGSGADGI